MVQYILEYMFSHSFWGLCAWDLPALIVLALMILIFVIHRDKMEEFEEELEKIQGEEAVDSI